MRKPHAVLIVTLVALTAGVLVIPAQAVNRGNLGDLSPTTSPIIKSFPALSGTVPAGPRFFAYVRQENCRRAATTYCDNHEFTVTVPDNYPFIHSMKVTLTWEPPTNNLDLYVWNNDVDSDPTNAALGPAYQFSSGTGRHPEQVSADEPDSGKYWITVVKADATVNTGYTLRLDWATIGLGEVSTGRRPARGGGSGGGTAETPKQASRPFAFGDFDEEDLEAAEDITIKVPGPDGELVEMSLPTYVRSQQRRDQGASFVPITIGVIVAIAVGLFIFFMWRRRREESHAV